MMPEKSAYPYLTLLCKEIMYVTMTKIKTNILKDRRK